MLGFDTFVQSLVVPALSKEQSLTQVAGKHRRMHGFDLVEPSAATINYAETICKQQPFCQALTFTRPIDYFFIEKFIVPRLCVVPSLLVTVLRLTCPNPSRYLQQR